MVWGRKQQGSKTEVAVAAFDQCEFNGVGVEATKSKIEVAVAASDRYEFNGVGAEAAKWLI